MSKKGYLIIVGIVAAAVALSLLFYTMLGNHRPVITSLTATSERVLPSGSSQIVCNATDSDGNELSYGWSADGGAITGRGATVTWTAPTSVGFYNITAIVLDSRGGGVMKKVTIEVRTNRPPTINSLVADPSWTTPEGSLRLTCNATDPDGDVLSYVWTATGGNISGTGAVVNWTAPEEVGIYNITVVVKDAHGREDTRFISLSVSLSAPPTIENLTVIAKEPKYLKTTSTGYTVGRTKQYDIACNVSNTSGVVSYNWSCESGVISGEGFNITWTAPDESLDRTIVTVIVADAAGNVSRSVVFKVASCNSCTFG